MFKRFASVILLFATGACAAEQGGEESGGDDALSSSNATTIYRDAFGTAHVWGTSDADAALGFAYAQAEDNFWQIEDNFIRATGRASEVYGEAELASDWIVRALEIEALSRRDYENAEPEIAALLDGFAAGLNLYVSRNNVETRLIGEFEPWHPLALIRYLYYARGFLFSSGLGGADIFAAMEALNGVPVREARLNTPPPYGVLGSNSWAANGDKVEGAKALLFINPHLPFFGPSQVYEGHVMSAAGWNFTGYTRFGFPLPYVGFNEELGWASTDNRGDQADLYVEDFIDPEDPGEYRYGDGPREASRWSEAIQVLAKDGTLEQRDLNFLKTHHGAVVGLREGHWLAVRMAKFEEGGWLDQWYAMTRARNLAEFSDAVDELDMQFGNYMYADRAGNILYVYNGAIPRREAAFDWSQPVDGSDPATEWQGYHAFGEIPQVLNPPSGWMQNTNSTPFLTSPEGENPLPDDFPPYMVNEMDNARSRNARRILTSVERFDYETWAMLSYDTYLQAAGEELPGLFSAFDELLVTEAEVAAELADAVEMLRQWDHRATIDSVETTLFVHWIEARNRADRLADPIGAFGDALDTLERHHGTWQVAWGEINRFVRGSSQGMDDYCEDCASTPSSGTPSFAGASFIMNSQAAAFGAPRWGIQGNSYIAVVAFGERVSGRSLHTFGPSADAASPHFFDQAVRHQTGDYKPAWLTLDEVRENAVTSYQPGAK